MNPFFQPKVPMILLTVAVVPLCASAGRPLVIDDAAAVPPGYAEVEAGIGLVTWSDARHYDMPFGISAGIVETLELGLGFGGQLEEREESFGGRRSHSGLGDFVAGAKWNPVGEEFGWTSHALAASVKLPTAETRNGLGSGRADFDLTYIASKTLLDRANAHVNLGYTFIGHSDSRRSDDIVHCGVAIGVLLSPVWEWVTEVYADVPSGDAEDWGLAMNGGLRWSISGDLVLDAAVGTRLRGPAPHLMATAGLTWTFGWISEHGTKN